MSDSKIVQGFTSKEDNFFKLIKGCFANDNVFAEVVAGTLRMRAATECRYEERQDQKGFVYFLHDGSLCKIGKTKNKPRNRMKALKVGNAKIQLIGYIETGNRDLLEAQLHERFKKRRVDGEWFRLSVSSIKSLLSKERRI